MSDGLELCPMHGLFPYGLMSNGLMISPLDPLMSYIYIQANFVSDNISNGFVISRNTRETRPKSSRRSMSSRNSNATCMLPFAL